MSIRLELAFDLTQSKEVTKSSSHTYAQCLEMCTWADQAGFHGVSFGEHHTNTSHYLSSPIVMGSAASACTDRVDIRMVVLAPFYSPLRLAEDLAVLTLASGGRSLVVLAAGYRQPEFDYYDVELNQRAAIIEETVEVLQRAWARESFTYQGRHIELVSPVPEHAPRIVLGGASPLMARMAARLNLGFAPGSDEIYQIYRAECLARGHADPGPRPIDGPHFLFLSEDPDKAWSEIGGHILENAQMYAGFLSGTHTGANVNVPEVTLKNLQQSASHAIVTPDQCIALLKEKEKGGDVCFRNHVMPAGIDPERVWASLDLFATKVMPHLDLKPHPA